MKKFICFYLCFCVLILVGCSSKISKNHMEVYSKSELVLSTEDNNTIVDMLNIINDYSEYKDSVDIDNPDYKVVIGPVDRENNVDEYKIWIKDKQLIYLAPKHFENIPKLAVSNLTYGDFFKILNK